MTRIINFPKDFQCPNCKKELELDDEERFNEKIVCPNCGKEILPGEVVLPPQLNAPGVTAKDLSKRGGCLAAFLIAMMILNPLLGLYYIAIAETVYERLTDESTLITLLLILLPFVNLLFAILMWNWKKVGLVGFWATSIIALLINISLEIPAHLVIAGLVGPIILTALYNKEKEKFS